MATSTDTAFVVALAGNPNTGKSSIFNGLTGANQHVGNWPGKTVARAHGEFHERGFDFRIVDLPGAYTLDASSPEEVIARDFVVGAGPDAVVVVLDATGLERNLYLATQIIETERPCVVALTMIDMAESQGLTVDVDALAAELGVPVVPMVARRKEGIDRLAEVLADLAAADQESSRTGTGSMRHLVEYPSRIETAIEALQREIEATAEIIGHYPSRWLAIALLDRERNLDEELVATGADVLLERRDELAAEVESEGIDLTTTIAGHRYDVAHRITAAATSGRTDATVSTTDRIDAVLTNRWLGIPIFLALMWAVFKITTDVAGAFLDWVDGAIAGPISQLVTSLVEAVGLGGTWVESLLVDGVIAGVGAILVFVPVLMSLYLALAFLEDTGYMARVAFVMDRAMRGIGLQGKSFLPMVVGFGCTVPAVYATRTLEDRRDRIVTTLLVPFMSCGARLPVYVLMGTIFFPDRAGLAVFAMYLLGMAVALVLGLILKATVLPVTHYAPTVMELPPYRVPTVRSIWFHTWVRTRAFLAGAGTIIFATMMVVWLLMAIPTTSDGSFADTDVDDSAFATIAGVAAPVFEPAGFGTWEATGSLMSGFVAKEVVIGTMAQVYGVDEVEEGGEDPSVVEAVSEVVTGFGQATVDAVRAIPGIVGIDLSGDEEESESSALMTSIETGFVESSGGHGALAAFAFMVFVLLYTPCMAAVGAIRDEIGTRWMWASVIGQFALAWAMAVLVFQAGKGIGF